MIVHHRCWSLAGKSKLGDRGGGSYPRRLDRRAPEGAAAYATRSRHHSHRRPRARARSRLRCCRMPAVLTGGSMRCHLRRRVDRRRGRRPVPGARRTGAAADRRRGLCRRLIVAARVRPRSLDSGLRSDSRAMTVGRPGHGGWGRVAGRGRPPLSADGPGGSRLRSVGG